MNLMLTEKQIRVLRYFRDYRREKGIAPTLDEAAQALGVSKITIHEHLNQLTKKGAIHRDRAKARAVAILHDPDAAESTAVASEVPTLPLVGRIADGWNCWYRGDDDWNRRKGIVHAAAERAGRDPGDIEITNTIEKPLPTTDEESEQLLEVLRHRRSLGITHFVMDFGHPQSTEPVLRFVEQVMAPLRAGDA